MEGKLINDYQYQQLPNKKDKRILVLKPATSFKDPLECHLEYRPWLPEKLQREEEDLEEFLDAKRDYELHYRQWQAAKHQYDNILDRLTRREEGAGKPLARRLAEVNYEMVSLVIPGIHEGILIGKARQEAVYNEAKKEFHLRTVRFGEAEKRVLKIKRVVHEKEVTKWKKFRGRYEAVSHVLSHQTATEEILCGDGTIGFRLRITKSVDTMLRHLRSQQKIRYLWINDICINQNDTKEISKQISWMRSVYEEAKRVVLWVGDDAEGGQDVLVFFVG